MIGIYKLPKAGIYYFSLMTDCKLSIIVLMTNLKSKGDNLSTCLTPLLDEILGRVTLSYIKCNLISKYRGSSLSMI